MSTAVDTVNTQGGARHCRGATTTVGETQGGARQCGYLEVSCTRNKVFELNIVLPNDIPIKHCVKYRFLIFHLVDKIIVVPRQLC